MHTIMYALYTATIYTYTTPYRPTCITSPSRYCPCQ